MAEKNRGMMDPLTPLDDETKEAFEKEERELKGRTITKETDGYQIYKNIADQLGNTFSIRLDNYVENVQRFHSFNPFFYDKKGLFWFWNKALCKYELTDDTQIMILLDSILGLEGQTVSSTIKNNYLEAFRRVGRKSIPASAPIKWLQFKNKAFSLESKQTYDVFPNYFFTNPIPHSLGDSEETPVMDKLFRDWVGDAYAPTLYEILAYCCYQSYPIHVIISLIGSGRNGKSQFQILLKRFLGEDNITSTELDMLLENRFETTKLFHKLACIVGETNFDRMQKTSIIKKLTGGDLIGYEFKCKQPFDDVNYCKIIISSNSLPTSHDNTDGFYRRWLIIPFNNEFPEGKDIVDTIPREEYRNLALKVTRMLPSLLEVGKITNQGSIEDRKRAYITSSNPLPEFIRMHCQEGYLFYEKYAIVYKEYLMFLAKLKRRRVRMREFKEALEDLGFYVEKADKKINGEFIWGYYVEGIKLAQNGQNSTNSANSTVFSIPPIERNYKGKMLVEKAEFKEKLPEIEIIGPTPDDFIIFFEEKGGSYDAVTFDIKYGKKQAEYLLSQGIIYEMPKGTYKLLK